MNKIGPNTSKMDVILGITALVLVLETTAIGVLNSEYPIFGWVSLQQRGKLQSCWESSKDTRVRKYSIENHFSTILFIGVGVIFMFNLFWHCKLLII